MIPDARIRVIAEHDANPGKYVLYWMQASQRTCCNHALEYAVARANDLNQPLLVCFGLMDDYPEANARHYAFMLEGLADVAAALRKRSIAFTLRHGRPPEVALSLADDASLIVCDRGYTRHQKAWRDEVADAAGRPVFEVESDALVPADEASDKQEYAARTIRPKLLRLQDDYLTPLPQTPPSRSGLSLKIDSHFDPQSPHDTLVRLKLDRSASPVPHFRGGQTEAQRRLSEFIQCKLSTYDECRNEPSAAHTSALSPYLHFGHISPLDIALQVRAADADDGAKAYLEELLIRRELAINFVHHCPNYDRYEALPRWARQTLRKHARDKRPYLYSRPQLESAATHDPWWNAAQAEMNKTGFMHNYMRMYWGKKVLEWTRTPEEAYESVLHLNNKLFLCGRSPNAYANVAWVFGLHDRPWGPERPIFGTIRYMNAAGLQRKFDMPAYARRIAAL